MPRHFAVPSSSLNASSATLSPSSSRFRWRRPLLIALVALAWLPSVASASSVVECRFEATVKDSPRVIFGQRPTVAVTLHIERLTERMGHSPAACDGLFVGTDVAANLQLGAPHWKEWLVVGKSVRVQWTDVQNFMDGPDGVQSVQHKAWTMVAPKGASYAKFVGASGPDARLATPAAASGTVSNWISAQGAVRKVKAHGVLRANCPANNCTHDTMYAFANQDISLTFGSQTVLQPKDAAAGFTTVLARAAAKDLAVPGWRLTLRSLNHIIGGQPGKIRGLTVTGNRITGQLTFTVRRIQGYKEADPWCRELPDVPMRNEDCRFSVKREVRVVVDVDLTVDTGA